MNKTRVILTLEDTREGPPRDIRLRRLLKVALRVFSFRAVDVREVNVASATNCVTVADAKK